jgi:tRNA (cytidine56-2'-O)-methyltransferase
VAVFLDRLFKGEELAKSFQNADVKIIPQRRGKKVVRQRNRETRSSCKEI